MIPVAEVILGEQEKAYVNDCLESGWISSLGKYVPAFEEAFSRFCETRFGVAASNGTTALHLALEVLGVGPGDEVIIPSLTFVATANAVRYTGATPVFADSEGETWNMDPESVRRCLTSRTRGILPVHLYGHPADMEPLLALAREHGLWVLEDAAEAHGARCRGRRVGGLGIMGCFSFYGNKIITTGEGGMIVTNDPTLAEKAAWLRDHGMSREKRYWHPVVGYNYRMTNIQAAIGLGQLERIESILARKRAIAQAYAQRLQGVPGIQPQPEAAWAENVFWMYSVLVDEAVFGLSRDAFMAALREREIDSRPFFYPIHTMPPYAQELQLPVAERLARSGVNLPSGLSLTDGQIAYICETIASLARG
ncbi:MAG: DegT/DnrJ/EryC1/StrS family aminotransferase [Chloroflexi bacterium]|nr:DegT/DnrJ/EryC1/StrS family aminotransferase [Chloroflexota bacterium]